MQQNYLLLVIILFFKQTLLSLCVCAVWNMWLLERLMSGGQQFLKALRALTTRLCCACS